MFHGKKYKAALEKIDPNKEYSLEEAINLLKEISYANFDETVEIAFNLGVDPRKADQMIRGSVTLPHGTGKTKKILVFAEGDQAKEAQEAGADYVGSDELIEKIQQGWIDFDVVVATPQMMPKIGKLGRILGPKGLMPNPKDGTVTNDVKKIIEEIKKGKVTYRVDKHGNLHGIIGKISFDTDKLVENAKTFISAIQKAKPATAKGTYMRKIVLSTTMSPGVKIDLKSI